jgi:prepilin-type N-terminal cleavage/methylation domain-containing protein
MRILDLFRISRFGFRIFVRSSLAVKEFAVKSIHPRSAGRAGFTLIEILVVIAIIAILAALLTGGLWAIMGKGTEAKARNDILQLSTALQNFKAKYGFYPPDRILLHASRSQYVADSGGINDQSVMTLSRMFPKLDSTNPATNASYFTNVAWAGPGVAISAKGILLEGDQALVFFLGGPPAGTVAYNAADPTVPVPLLGGFLSNPTDPIGTAASAQDRIKFMTFDAARLQFVATTQILPNTAAGVARAPTAAISPFPYTHGYKHFPSYIDAYNKVPDPMPYVYFGSGSRANGYLILGTAYPNSVGVPSVSPYLQTSNPVAYQNATTYQLICAGQNGQFGAGGVAWPPSQVGLGADDMTNFTDVKLGNAP